jgi:hypothetical protein
MSTIRSLADVSPRDTLRKLGSNNLLDQHALSAGDRYRDWSMTQAPNHIKVLLRDPAGL